MVDVDTMRVRTALALPAQWRYAVAAMLRKRRSPFPATRRIFYVTTISHDQGRVGGFAPRLNKRFAPAAPDNDAREGRMTESATRRIYDLWSKVYDASFGVMVQRRQALAVRQFDFRSGQRVLDIGVGTGLTLPCYPREVHVVGLDLSAGMLARANQKCRDMKLDHCHLLRTDAMLPPFKPRSFDHVMISHTISVVSEPERLLQWARTLIRPGGRIILLNHFLSTNPLIARIERLLNPLCTKLGWRSDLSLETLLGDVDLEVQYCVKRTVMDVWWIVVLQHRAESPAPMNNRVSVQPVSAAIAMPAPMALAAAP